MSSVEKVLKKVEQERSKGNLERALTRLKEAISEHPREFAVAKEAALAAFELGKPLDGVTVLRSAMRRCPNEREEALSIARFEFDTTASLEVGELLYDSYLSQPDFQKAREVVAALAAPDQKKLLSKLNTRIQSMHESVPDEKRRLLGLRLAEAIAYSALKQPVEVAESLQNLLELDQKQVEIVGRLCKAELRKFSDCAEIRLLLARCYLLVQEPGLAAEQLLAQATDAGFRAQAYGILEVADDVIALKHVRGVLQLLDEDIDAAHETLSDLLSEDANSAVVIRQTLEKVPEIRDASPKLKLLYAEVLARTDQMKRALKEIETVHAEGNANDECLPVLDTLLQMEGQETEVRRLRAKVALELGQSTEAAHDLRKAIESGGAHAQGLKSEIETVFQQTDCDPALGRTLVNLYVDENDPQKAVDTLSRMHELGQTSAQEMFELASSIAGKYGFTSALAVLFVEVAIDVERLADAQAAISHYLASPGAHVEEFTSSLTVLIRKRTELCEPLAKSLQNVELSPEMRLFVLRARFETGDLEAAVRDLEAIVAADTHLTRLACELLEEYLESNEDAPAVLELLARLYADHDKRVEAAVLLARAILSDPSCSDRVCRQADRMLQLDPAQHELWRPLINALMDVNRQRHARELCFQASQSIAAKYQGFVHAAMAQIQLESGQLDSAIGEARQASECVDVPWQRLEALLRQILDQDPQHGYVHFLMGKALLALEGPAAETIDHFEQATRHDSVTRELVLETLREKRETLQNVSEALVLEGTLLLQRGDRASGIELLRQVLQQSPESSEAVLRTLQTQWDQDPDDIETGLALAKALNNVEQLRRACRLLADLAERFPEHQPAAIDLLQEVLAKKPIAEAHQALWDIHLGNNEREKAVHHVQLALEDLATEPDAYRSLLETAHRQVPESIWVSCRMAELVLADGNDTYAETLLRGLLESNLAAAEQVILVIEPRAEDSLDLALLRVDALLASNQWLASLEALRKLKKSFPESDQSCMERYRVLMERGDTELAANVEFGMLLREAGDIEEATRVFEETLKRAVASKIADKEHEVRLILASLYADLGREEEGRELLSAVLEEAEDPSEAYKFIEQVTRKGIVGKLKKLQESIRHSPGNLRARLELARLSLVSGDFSTARESLRFAGDSPVIEATRLYLLARSYSDDDQPQLAIAVLRSIGIDDVADDELRRNIVYLMATCSEQLGYYGEAHARYLRLLSECPGYKDTHKRARETYQKHLETSLETRPLVLEKRISFEMS